MAKNDFVNHFILPYLFSLSHHIKNSALKSQRFFIIVE